MTDLVLDTNALIYAVTDSRVLTTTARTAIADPGNALLASSASIYEVGIKHEKGRLPFGASELRAACEPLGVAFRAPGAEIMARAATLDWTERDPWDRIVAATAIEATGGRVVTRDRAFDALAALERIW